MRSFQIILDVQEDGKVVFQLPENIPPGKHEFIIVLNEEVILDEEWESFIQNELQTRNQRQMNFPHEGFDKQDIISILGVNYE